MMSACTVYMKRNPIKTWRNKCDALLTPIVKKLFPLCFLCGGETEVAHHHVHKSKSTALRYVLANLIPLCGRCHVKLHHNESYWASVIVERKGIEWWRTLQREGNKTVDANLAFFKENYEQLLKYEKETTIT